MVGESEEQRDQQLPTNCLTTNCPTSRPISYAPSCLTSCPTSCHDGENDIQWFDHSGATSDAPVSNAVSDESLKLARLSEDEACEALSEPADADVDLFSVLSPPTEGIPRSLSEPCSEPSADGQSSDQLGPLRPSMPMPISPRMSFRKLVDEGVVEQCRKRIEDIYRRHRPEKVADLEALFAQHRGGERQLYEKVCAKYGVPPEPRLLTGPAFRSELSEPLSTAQYYKQRIEAVYRAAAPGKLKDVDQLMEAYRGREAELLNLVWVRHCDVLQGSSRRQSTFTQEAGGSLQATDPVGDSQVSEEVREVLRYRSLICFIYATVGSERLYRVDQLLAQHAGREQELFSLICAKYNVTPDSIEALCRANEARGSKADTPLTRGYRERIVAIYENAKPEKLRDVDLLLKQHEGREYEAYTGVCAKYGVTPEPEIKVCSRCLGQGRVGLCGLRTACIVSRQCPACRFKQEKPASAILCGTVNSTLSTRRAPRSAAFPTPF